VEKRKLNSGEGKQGRFSRVAGEKRGGGKLRKKTGRLKVVREKRATKKKKKPRGKGCREGSNGKERIWGKGGLVRGRKREKGGGVILSFGGKRVVLGWGLEGGGGGSKGENQAQIEIITLTIWQKRVKVKFRNLGTFGMGGWASPPLTPPPEEEEKNPTKTSKGT